MEQGSNLFSERFSRETYEQASHICILRIYAKYEWSLQASLHFEFANMDHASDTDSAVSHR